MSRDGDYDDDKWMMGNLMEGLGLDLVAMMYISSCTPTRLRM